jgi:hypothetical protein
MNEEYMINKGHKIRYGNGSLNYGDDIPNDVILHPSWIEQRVVILKKDVKENLLKQRKKEAE